MQNVIKKGFLPLYDFDTFLNLSSKKSLILQELNSKEKLHSKFQENKEYLIQMYHYSLLSHAAYLSLDLKDIFVKVSQKELFKILTNFSYKNGIAIGKFDPFMAFYFIKNFVLLAHINENFLESKGGFRASLFQDRNTQEFILAIAGSDLRPIKFDLGDIWSDFLILNHKIPKAQYLSLCSFYKKLKSKFQFKKITLVGHSLGGYLAQIFIARLGFAVDRIYTFQAPGLSKNIKNNSLHTKNNSYHFYTHHLPKEQICWHHFNFVQALHSKKGNKIILNLGTRLHHPRLCLAMIYKVLKLL